MLKQRIPETDEGIQDALTVEVFDQFARNMRDKGYHNIDGFLNAGIKGDGILEIGPGPGYVGLELLKALPDTRLTGCEISPEMRKLAQKNASAYGFADRVNYVQGNGMQMPFPDGMFDAVFSNGSLHEWEEPVQVFDEIHRVLRPGGAVCICDMRRDIAPLWKWMAYATTKPKAIRPGFLSSLNASYTVEEMQVLLSHSALHYAAVSRDFFGLTVSGTKPGK